MPEGMITMLDILKAGGNDAVVGLFDEATKTHPELTQLPARTIKGKNYKTLVRVALGRTSGSFRSYNQGIAPIKNVYENRQFETYLMEPRWEADKAVADEHEDGAAAYIAMEAQGILEGEMQALSTQFYYGVGAGGNASAFPGLIDIYDSTNMVIDAGGTTASTGSSVWLVRAGVQAVQWVWGLNGEIKLNPLRIESLADDVGKKFDGYVQTMTGRPGLQVLSTQAVCRIKKLTTDEGKGLNDARLTEAIAKFPTGRGPTHIYMSKRSAQQLQSSRTATSPTGAPAPWVKGVEGMDGSIIPIHITEGISNTEAMTL